MMTTSMQNCGEGAWEGGANRHRGGTLGRKALGYGTKLNSIYDLTLIPTLTLSKTLTQNLPLLRGCCVQMPRGAQLRSGSGAKMASGTNRVGYVWVQVGEDAARNRNTF